MVAIFIILEMAAIQDGLQHVQAEDRPRLIGVWFLLHVPYLTHYQYKLLNRNEFNFNLQINMYVYVYIDLFNS